MAGSNQATNLTGMLNQIGDTLGRERDISGLTRGIENMSRPDIHKPNGMMRVADWQNQMGRSQEAAVTTRMAADQQAATTAAEVSARGASVDAYSQHVNELLRQREVAQQNNPAEVAAIDAELASVPIPNSDAMSIYKNSLDVVKDQNAARATARTSAGVETFSKNEAEIARLRQEASQPGPAGEAAATRIAALEKNNRQLLRTPGVSAEIKKITDAEVAVSGREDQARVAGAEERVWSAFSGPGGALALEVLLENNPELAKDAAGAIKEIREFKEERDKVLAAPVTVKGNQALADDMIEKYGKIEGLKDWEKEVFEARINHIMSQDSLPEVQQEVLMARYTEVFQAASSIAGTERAAEARLAAEGRATENKISTKTLSNSELQAGASILPDVSAFTKARSALSGDIDISDVFSGPELETVRQLARDQLRHEAGLPRLLQYDEKGKARLDKNFKPIPAGAGDTGTAPKTSAEYLEQVEKTEE